jgi:hypothetical protein
VPVRYCQRMARARQPCGRVGLSDALASVGSSHPRPVERAVWRAAARARTLARHMVAARNAAAGALSDRLRKRLCPLFERAARRAALRMRRLTATPCGNEAIGPSTPQWESLPPQPPVNAAAARALAPAVRSDSAVHRRPSDQQLQPSPARSLGAHRPSDAHR